MGAGKYDDGDDDDDGYDGGGGDDAVASAPMESAEEGKDGDR
jgi:hypothetical protein